MEITVNMPAEEFLDFMAWKKDHAHHKAEVEAVRNKLEYFAKKTCWAIEEDPKRPGKVKIVDQDHAAELLEQARDFLE